MASGMMKCRTNLCMDIPSGIRTLLKQRHPKTMFVKGKIITDHQDSPTCHGRPLAIRGHNLDNDAAGVLSQSSETGESGPWGVETDDPNVEVYSSKARQFRRVFQSTSAPEAAVRRADIVAAYACIRYDCCALALL
jgi:hypothetical protein